MLNRLLTKSVKHFPSTRPCMGLADIFIQAKQNGGYFGKLLVRTGVISFLFGATALFGQGLDANKSIEDSVVAVVGNKNITVKEFSAGYEFGPAFPKKEKNSKKIYLNYMINEKLLSLEGALKKMDTTETFRSLYSDICSDLATEELYKKEVLPNVSLTEDEIAVGITRKNTEIYLRWIFCEKQEDALAVQNKLKKGQSFDSLFETQLNDSLFRDERTFKTDKFKLWQKNPVLAKIADTLRAGAISRAIPAGDGWYIVKTDSIVRKISLGEGDYNEARQEVSRALTAIKADGLSDKYVDSLMKRSELVIDGNAFRIIRSYVGKYELTKETYTDWNFEKLSDKAYADLDKGKKNDPASFPLVKMKDTAFTIGDFVYWYSQRVDFLKVSKSDKKKFSADIESLIWRMVRDNILTSVARTEGMTESPAVKAQAEWWKDKILYALVREEMKNSLPLKNSETAQSILQPKTNSDMSTEINKVLFRKVASLKNKYKVTINDSILKRIAVQDENNSKAVDMYIVKKGGIYPHPAFPTIDKYWQMWE